MRVGSGAGRQPFLFFAILLIVGTVAVLVAVTGNGSGRPAGIAPAAAAPPPVLIGQLRAGAAGPVYAGEVGSVVRSQAQEVCSAWESGQTRQQVTTVAGIAYPAPGNPNAAGDVRRFVELTTAAMCPTYGR